VEGASFNEMFGAQLFTFLITYQGGTGNDIVLNVASVSAVPIPPAGWLFGAGLVGLIAVSRRRKVV
jgi:MYXO-CTERM domain-containing protein